MHADRATVTDLIQTLKAGHPNAEVRLAQQPPGRSSTPSTPAHAAVVQVDLDRTPVVNHGEGAQLGYLPEPVRTQLSR